MGDSTIQDLPYVGETGADGQFDPTGSLALFINTLRTEAVNDRTPHTNQHPACEDLYLFGTTRPGQKHVYPKIQGMIDTFFELATSTPPTATVKTLTHMDGGQQLLTTSGKPLLLDSTALADFVQRQLDYTLDKSRGNSFYNTVAKNALVYGDQRNLIEWDEILDLPKYRVIPELQWYVDPTEQEIENAHYRGLDWPIDAQEAKRLYPQVSDAIDDAASRAIYPEDGSSSYSKLYYDFPIARPMVTLSIWWLRNHEMPMTDQEAIASGKLESRPLPNPDDPTAPPSETMFHKEEGTQVHSKHPLWPMKLVTRQCIQIRGKIVYDGECTEWDIPSADNFNIRYPNQPYGQSECIRVQTLQEDLNSTHADSVDHARWFKGPTVFADQRLKEMTPEKNVRNMGMEPNKTYWYDSQGGTLKASDLFEVLNPPPLPPVVEDIKRDLKAAFDDAAGRPASLQGDTPTSNASGELAKTLYAAAAATASAKFKYLEEFWWRTCMLVLHNIRTRRTPERMAQIDRTFDVATIERIILPLWESVELTLSVTIAGGQGKASRDAAARADFTAGLIDEETACDLLDYDYQQIQQRRMTAAVAAGVVPNPNAMPGQPSQGATSTTGSQVPARAGATAPAPPVHAESA